MQRFNFKGASTMRHLLLEVNSSYDDKNACLAEINLIGENGKPVAKDAWTVVYVNTEQADEGPAEYLFDESARSYWHSQWKKEPTTAFPHRIIIDLGESRPSRASKSSNATRTCQAASKTSVSTDVRSSSCSTMRSNT